MITLQHICSKMITHARVEQILRSSTLGYAYRVGQWRRSKGEHPVQAARAAEDRCACERGRCFLERAHGLLWLHYRGTRDDEHQQGRPCGSQSRHYSGISHESVRAKQFLGNKKIGNPLNHWCGWTKIIVLIGAQKPPQKKDTPIKGPGPNRT